MALFFVEKYTLQAIRQFLGEWLGYRMQQENLVGLSVVVSIKGNVIFSKAYGIADESALVPLTTDHLFCMASQTKMLTAALVMRAAEKNKLHIDDVAVNYIPWLAQHADERVRTITIRHLLMHGSGLLRDGNMAAHWLGEAQAPSVAQLRNIVLKHPLVFQPGASVKYSNVGYALLGLILEKVEARSFSAVTAEVLEELGIKGGIVLKDDAAHRLSKGYGIPMRGIRTQFSKQPQLRSLTATAGLYATPRDMSRLTYELLMGESVIGPASQTQMRASQNQVQDGYDEGLVFGLGVEHQRVGELRVVGHTGHAAGHVSATLCDIDRQLVVSVAANAKDTPTTSIARGIMGVLHYFIHVSGAGDQNLAHFNARLGNKMSTVQIVATRDKLVMIDPDDWEPFGWFEELEKVNDTTLRCITKNSVYNGGEILAYQFEKSRLLGATIAGFPFKPI